jgi:hypothetical protein
VRQAEVRNTDTLYLDVTVSPPSGTIVRLTARVDDRSQDLASGQGKIPLAGLAEGLNKTVSLTAVSSTGDSAVKVVSFRYNRPPQIAVTLPPRNTVLRAGTVRIDVDCADPSGCAKVEVVLDDWWSPPPARRGSTPTCR